MPNAHYTADHLWLRLQGGIATVGLTRFALGVLGPVSLLHLPPPGRRIQAGQTCGIIESMKAASDIHAPLSGAVTEVCAAGPDLLNRDPEGGGWLFRMVPDDPGAVRTLMDGAAYTALIGAM